MDALKRELDAKGLPSDPEHCVVHAMFPQQLEAHLTGASSSKPVVVPVAQASHQDSVQSRKHYALTINGKRVEVDVEELAS